MIGLSLKRLVHKLDQPLFHRRQWSSDSRDGLLGEDESPKWRPTKQWTKVSKINIVVVGAFVLLTLIFWHWRGPEPLLDQPGKEIFEWESYPRSVAASLLASALLTRPD